MLQEHALVERIECLEEDLQDNRTQLLAVRDEFDHVQQENDDLTEEMDRANQTKMQLHATQGDLFSARQSMKILQQKVVFLERLSNERREENEVLQSGRQPRKRSFAQHLLKAELNRKRLAVALEQGDPDAIANFVHELTDHAREVERVNNLLQKKQKQIDAFQKLRATENAARKQADGSLLFAFSKYKLDTDQFKATIAEKDSTIERMQQQIEDLKAARDQFRSRNSAKIRIKDTDNFFRYVSADQYRKQLRQRSLRPIRKQRKPRSKSVEVLSPRKSPPKEVNELILGRDGFLKPRQVRIQSATTKPAKAANVMRLSSEHLKLLGGTPTPAQKMKALRARIQSGLPQEGHMDQEFKTWLSRKRADVQGALSRIDVSLSPCIRLVSSPTA